MLVQFATQSHKLANSPVSAQRVVNFYAERQPPDAKTQVAVFGCPGLTEFGSVGIGPIRGIHVMGGVLYVVSGQYLYSVANTGTGTQIGGTISGSGPVGMDDNGTQLVIVNGAFGYVYSVAGGFQLITDAQFNAADTVKFFDQVFVFDWKNTNKFFISGILDGTAFSATEFTSSEARPDNVKAVDLNGQTLIVFNEKTIEPYYDAGLANFPFQRIEGALIERGIAASHAKAKADNTLFFLGHNRVFYRFDGLRPVRVSNHALEEEWARYSAVSDAFAFSYQFAGHEFIPLTFPTANTTFEYDVASGLWHERESWDDNNNSYGSWRGSCHASCYGHELIGDRFSGKIGKLDSEVYAEYGNVMRGLASAPPLHADRKRLFMSRFELDMETGVGVTTGQGSDPQVMLDYSDDGGKTWSSRQLWKSMGAKGAYRTRLKWDRLGSFRQRVMRIQITDPVRRVIVAAHADVTVGIS